MPRTLGPVCLLFISVVGCASTKLASFAQGLEDAGESVDEPDADESSEPDASVEPSLPSDPESFRIQLSGGSCLGDCPSYRVSIDQAGHVEFTGTRCVARPGTYSHDVAAEDARAIYDALSRTEYGRLNERYFSEADGCPEVVTDAPISTWIVTVDGREKRVDVYGGCFGIDALNALRLVEKTVDARSDALRYLEPNPRCLDGGRAPFATLRVSKEGTAIAMLELKALSFPDRPPLAFPSASEYELRDCAGTVIAQGSLHSEGPRLVLLEDLAPAITGTAPITLPPRADVTSTVLSIPETSPIALPTIGDVASIIVDLLGDSYAAEPQIPVKAHALRQESDVDLDLTPASTCL
jgi:hypothetical protein